LHTKGGIQRTTNVGVSSVSWHARWAREGHHQISTIGLGTFVESTDCCRVDHWEYSNLILGNPTEVVTGNAVEVALSMTALIAHDNIISVLLIMVSSRIV